LLVSSSLSAQHVVYFLFRTAQPVEREDSMKLTGAKFSASRYALGVRDFGYPGGAFSGYDTW